MEDIGDAQGNAKEYTENTGPVRTLSATVCKFPPSVGAPADSKQSQTELLSTAVTGDSL